MNISCTINVFILCLLLQLSKCKLNKYVLEGYSIPTIEVEHELQVGTSTCKLIFILQEKATLFCKELPME